MTQKEFKVLLNNFEESLEQRYDDEVNNPWSASDEFIYDAQILQEHGVGAVWVAKPNGRMGWMNLNGYTFNR